MSKVITPTLDKVVANKAESQAIGNFLEWLSEHGKFIAYYPRRSECAAPVTANTEELLAEYFEIDLAEAERERVKILAALRRTK